MPHSPAEGPDAAPRILPLVLPGVGVRELLDSIVAGRSRSSVVRLTLDVSIDVRVAVDAGAFRSAVERLVASACAAACDARRGEGPPVHDVVITAVDGPDAFELEIADSGPSVSFDERCPTAVRQLIERCGGTVGVADCPEGGTAVTIRLPRRSVRRQAA